MRMKRHIGWLAIVLLLTITVGCTIESSEDLTTDTNPTTTEQSTTQTTNDPIYHDSTPPTIAIDSDKMNVLIDIGADYDLMEGVTGHDNLEGDITDRVVMNKGKFDPEVSGEYVIAYFLADLAGNAAQTVFRTINVVDNRTALAPPIYNGVIEGEKLNPPAQHLFGGAWYHKVVSSTDKWVGIEGTVTLPEVKIRRYNDSFDETLKFDPLVKNLDNPSVYMGGKAMYESDVGLSFSLVLLDADNGTISKGSTAFRPFWRYITPVNKDEGGYAVHNNEYAVSCTGNNCHGNYHFRFTEYYYLPGDKLRMSIHIPEPNWMQLHIEVIEKSTLPESIAMRERYGWKDPENFKSPIFHSPGHGTSMNAEYKRVNAIDQSNNEGKTAIPTQTEILNGIWHETYLYRMIDGTMYRVPMNESRRSVLSAPDASRYTVSFDGMKEVINIHPGYTNKKNRLNDYD